MRDRPNRPAPTSSIVASASSAAARPLRTSARPCPAEDRSACFSDRVSSVFAIDQAGARPNNNPVSTVIPRANTTTVLSMVTVGNGRTPKGRPTLISRTAQTATAIPRRPPIEASTRLSTSSCLSRRLRLAPSAVRTAISRSRAIARLSNRFATLAHAISSTHATPPRSTSSDVWSCAPTKSR